jgi:hypothetical protein
VQTGSFRKDVSDAYIDAVLGKRRALLSFG